MKEFLRKTMVSLKRSPQNIPLVALAFAFVYYSFNLTKISDTTAKIQGQNMGLCGFVTMLFSILVFVCFLNAFPKRKKPNIAMLVIMYVMYAMIIVADLTYRSRIIAASARDDFASVLESADYISKAQTVVTVHVILVIAVAVLVALLPVYSKLLRKVNTSVDVEDNGRLASIDVSGED